MKKLFFALLLIVVTITAGFAASNFIQEGKVVTLTWSGTSPESGDPVVKSTASSTGGIVGVAITGAGTANESVSVQTYGVFELPVRAISSNIVAGDWVYTSVTNATVGVASLTNVATGLKFGMAMEGLVTGSNTQNIDVMIIQP